MFGKEKMKTNRSVWKYIMLFIVTLGIYHLVFISKTAKDVNKMCAGDGRKTTGAFKYLVFTLITLGIYSLVWFYKVENRLVKNARRYRCYAMNRGGAVVLLMLFPLVGYLIGLSFVIRSLNEVSESYNRPAIMRVLP